MSSHDQCHHVWLYYDMKVKRCRKQRRHCPRLEDKMWSYSLRAAGF